MGNTQQAPTLLEVGRDLWDKGKHPIGSLMVDNRIVNYISQKTGQSKAQFATMMFLLGNSQGGNFNVAGQTVEDRLGIKKSTYYDALKVLEKLGFISREQGRTIVVRYDNLYSQILGSGQPEQSGDSDSGVPEQVSYESGSPESINIIESGVPEQSGQPESGDSESIIFGSGPPEQDWSKMF